MSLLLAVVVIAASVLKLLRPPTHLHHIPCVPIPRLLISYLSGEVDEQRTKRIILPFAERNNADVVLVWCFGEWIVNIVNAKVMALHVIVTALKADRPICLFPRSGSK